VYRGHSSIAHTPTGDFEVYAGVPNAWGFLMFCAAWTFLVVIFQLIAGNAFSNRAHIGYVCVAVEAIAFLSWFTGWIAVAANIGTEACPEGYISCGTLKAAAVFGAVEWLLFIVTTTVAFSLVLESKRQSRTAMT